MRLMLPLLLLVSPTLLIAQDKSPVPDADAIKDAESLIQEVFKDEFDKATTPSQMSALAEMLLQQGLETKNDAAGRYTLFSKARDLAIESGNPTLTMKVIEEIGTSYSVDVVKAKAGSLRLLEASTRFSTQKKELAATALGLADELIAVSDFDSARQVSQIAIAAARDSRDAALIADATGRNESIEKLWLSFSKVKPAMKTLETQPTDSEANQTVGKFLCFLQGDWKKGLPMLALGKDTSLSKAASMELAGANEPSTQAELGDLWYEIADDYEGVERRAIQGRAALWYGMA